MVLDTIYCTKKSPDFLDDVGLCDFEDHFDALGSRSVSCLCEGQTKKFDHLSAEIALLEANLHSSFFGAQTFVENHEVLLEIPPFR